MSTLRQRLPDVTPPQWLVALARPKPAPVPWPAVVRAGIAVGAPLAITDAIGHLPYGLFVAMGALNGSVADRRGPYRVRALQIGLTAAAGAAGFAIGQAIYGAGWLTLGVLVVAAVLSAVASVGGAIASSASMQFLVFAIVAGGRAFPLPMWQPPLLYLAGGFWALGLTMLGLLRDAASPERRSVAAAFRAIADLADAIGTPAAEHRRRDVTDALNAAYDALLAGRIRSGGRSPAFRRFMGLLNSATPILEATVAAMRADRRLPDEVPARLREIAEALLARRPPPPLPDAYGATATEAAPSYPQPGVRDRMRSGAEQILSGHTSWLYGARIGLCVGIAELLRRVVPGERSYWIALTVAIVLKPDFGSVFARAVQRGGGTVIGVLIGAAILAGVPEGGWQILCIALLAATLPAAIQRHYGIFSAFLTPLVVLLLDLFAKHGWSLLGTRLVDTLLGCAVVLVVGYLLWPETFRSRIGPNFVAAADALAGYTRAALVPDSPRRPALRREAYRRLSDLRTVFQRSLAEPPPVSRRAAAWWPAIVALERLTDAATRAAAGIDRGTPPPAPADVDTLAAGIGDLAAALREHRRPHESVLPTGPPLDDITAELETARQVLTGPDA